MVAGPHRARLTAPAMLAATHAADSSPPPPPRSLSSWIAQAREGVERRQQQSDDSDEGEHPVQTACILAPD